MKKSFLHIILIFVLVYLVGCGCTNEKTVTLTLITNNDRQISPIYYIIGDDLALPTDLEKEGHLFEGWFFDKEFNVPFNKNDIKGDVEIYAKWQIMTFSVVFHYDAGKSESKTVKFGDYLQAPTEMSSETHNFQGWFLESDHFTQYSFDIPVKSNLELYAKWDEKAFHSVTIVDWDGTVVLETQVEHGFILGEISFFQQTIKEFKGLHLNDSVFDKDQIVTTPLILNVRYDYQISEIENFEFTLCEGGYYISAAKTIMGEIFLPPMYRGQAVVGIKPSESGDSGAFYDSQLTKIYIPSTYSLIGAYAFYKCSSLSDLYLGSGENQAIGRFAFYGTGLSRLELCDGVIEISDQAFSYCELLTEVSIPSTLAAIGEGVFSNCIQLEEIVVDEKNSVFKSYSGNLLSYDLKTFYCYAYGNSRTEFSLNSEVVNIRPYAFISSMYLINIELSRCENLLIISNYAFFGCIKLSGIELPDSVVTIGAYAFSNCYEMTTFIIGQNSMLENVYEYAFADCAMLKTIYLPSYAVFSDYSQNAVPARVFIRCYSLTEINVSNQNLAYSSVDGVLYSKDRTILYCYPASKKDVIYETERECEIIFDYAFYFAINLDEAILSKKVEHIGKYAFGYSGIKTQSFPLSLITIENNAYYYCANLITVEFADNSLIEFIGDFCFALCNNLESIVFTAAVPPVGSKGSINFLSLGSETKIYVPSEFFEEYLKVWSAYKDNIISIG